MGYPVIKGASYALIHARGTLLNHGTTQTVEYRNDPTKKYYSELSKQLRSFEQAVSYAPNQAFIGNISPDDLKEIPRPWYENGLSDAKKDGKFGAIIEEDELIGLVKIADVFNLVVLEEKFQETIREKLSADSDIAALGNFKVLNGNAAAIEEIEELIKNKGAQPLSNGTQLVGCVKAAHPYDHALSSEAMVENLVSKATAAYTILLHFKKNDLRPEDVDYIIECSEEAVGDMNQRGGGNLAKAIAEMCGCLNATGSDTRSFCSAPVHAIVQASGLVQSGIFKNVVVVGGGSTAKLGMNSREHLKKGMPILEDMMGAFAIHITENDGVNPVIRTDAIGRHKIGSGSSPVASMSAVVLEPLQTLGYEITDVDRFAAELHNPELTEPAGAGNIPQGNFKMIAALGVQKGQILKENLMASVEKFGMPGFAPTQGHVPSGVPFVGHCRDWILEGKIKRGLIIGKGSLFLGRMTNQFDGISFVLEENTGIEKEFSGEEEVRKTVAKLLRDCANSLKE
ncbi:glycine/sarcosine/betaine reductase complex component C subunit beta [Candidatus Contubernalis alkaliaceticus]|uniref:glycine/sarcosine/betaine reductase complex component C subunit beta n=1 Tax=Candidatus Contubernalis alkaliaceticus TaxID=338645 RepID=UPI001F4C49A2|nr:glycine/sarcosine/betaine reductase complex component C subunit beta [Candidatus Contubernalis alkalaceticus]UNC92923.1 glycine reductase [Candidatus Contubernalis alkalaceticus]